MPLTGPTCTVAILTEALADVDGDIPVVIQITGYKWLWRVGEIHLTAMSEHHHVDDTTIVLPQVYVIVDADAVIRYLPDEENAAPEPFGPQIDDSAENSEPGADAGAPEIPAPPEDEPAPDSAPPHGRLRRILRRWWTRKRAP